MIKKLLLTSLSPFLLLSCNKSAGTSTGNPMVDFYVNSSGAAATVAQNSLDRLFHFFIPQAIALPPPSSLVDASGNTVIITDFWFSIGKVEFKYSQIPETNEVDGSEVEYDGPFTIDMLATTPQSLATDHLAISNFHRLKYKLQKVSALPTGGPSGLLNQSIYLAGTVSGRQFIFTSSQETEGSVAGPSLVSAQESDRILLQIKIANLIKKINLSSIAAAATSATINEANLNPVSTPCNLINSQATNLYMCFIDGLSTEANLGRDLDRSGELESSEPTVK